MNNVSIEQIEQKIAEYACKYPKLVVGIDGYSGIGKTTLLSKLIENNPNIIPVARDDFNKPRKVIGALLENAKDKSKIMELEICDNEKIREIATKFKAGSQSYNAKIYNSETGDVDIEKIYDLSKSIMIIEGIFLFHPKLINDIFDLRIFLDGDNEAADERRRRREKERWGEDYFSDTHPDSYFRLIKIAFDRYYELYQPQERADLILKFK
jgi:uridine kinase